MRIFETGATRDSDFEKMDFEGFLAPIVIERYAQYMHRHRLQEDGQLRDSDNWQKMFGDKHQDVCMKSLWRHFFAVWKGYRSGNINEDDICAAIFNLMAMLYGILRNKNESEKDVLINQAKEAAKYE